ncbi:YchJ family protein [Kitasatospora azatica]|uniref:YchJ family protein n=1 Tax=Kitasatospora azatica TaxID=58347 RepID=UPI0005620C02|nr:YchJ family metal-binding protein [Kitasatospora azatica]
MSRRTTRPAKKPAATRTSDCPCGLPASYDDCCGRLHRGLAQASTAEQLMRSRYSAFVVQDVGYLLSSWHPDTRPSALDLAPELRWERLEILGGTDGGPFHTSGTVEFRAYYREGRSSGTMRENSRFVRHEGAWVYLDGEVEAD